ncbi:MAG: aldehyde dehydrogenase family protein, partial [Chloroflexi bacterium]|nr:aldehyde dehydrogenase family protein [Chloroflexota bacterium]
MLEDKDLLSVQEVRTKVDKAHAAWQKYRTYSQEQVDAIVERMAAAARANAKRLAELAVEETGYGNAKDKYVKNILNCDWLPRRMRGMKTIGMLRELPDDKIVEYAVPMGVVAAILPTTNPTSTAMYKILVSLKAGNAIVVSPHPRAFKCTCQTASIMYQAALEAGAPEDIIQCIEMATMEGIQTLMRHERTAVILATGGHGMVKSAYSSGKPAFGVGPGNVPVLIDTSADLEDAIAKVVAGKSFDYGTVCSSEQAIVAEYSMRDRIMALLKQHNAYFCNDQQKEALGRLLIQANWTVNPQCVGQAPPKIAKMAGFEVPAETSIICCEIEGVGKKYPLSAEKLSPVLSLIFVPDWNAAVDTCFALLKFGGAGHTAAIYGKNDTRIREYGARMPAMRVLVNTPSPQGSTGITTNVFPSMTLGCGAMAGNSTSDNVGPQHLINIKRLAYTVRTPEQAFEM